MREGSLPMTRLLLSGLLALSVSFAGIARAADPVPQFKSVQIAEVPRGLAVSIGTSGPLRYQASLIEAPSRIVIDMAGDYAAGKARWTQTPDPIKEIRGSQWKPGTARVVVELTQPVRHRIEEGATGLTLIIETPGGRKAEASRPADRMPAAKAEALKGDPSIPSLSKSRTPKIDVVAQQTPVAGDREPAKVDFVRPEPMKPKRSSADAAQAEGTADVPEPAAPTTESTAASAVVPVAATPPVLPFQVAQATPSAPAQPSVRESITHTGSNGGKLLTLDFKDADAVNVLRLLA